MIACVGSAGDDLVDRRAHAVTHRLHVLHERLLGGERPLFDADPTGVIGHTRGS
jgi:hypothetical protein